MFELTEIFKNSFNLIFTLNLDLIEIILLSLKVSCFSLFFSCIFGLPLGAFLAVSKFYGRGFLILFFNSMMGLPPVFVGLVLYIILSASGPLGSLELLYTPVAMIIAQFCLIIPIIVSLTRQVLEQMTEEYNELFKSLGIQTKKKILTILWDSRYSLLTCVLAGLGRSLSEVGAIIIVGGNIAHVTRVMTTAIALETSKGNLELAVALGFILICISFVVNLLVFLLKDFAIRFSYD
tara:strand:+ start:864 stop:1571 length:708 start_codon:yes stop_codon:yes gene_type:complete